MRSKSAHVHVAAGDRRAGRGRSTGAARTNERVHEYEGGELSLAAFLNMSVSTFLDITDGPTASALLSAALPPSFEIAGTVHTCTSAPKVGTSTWDLPGVQVSAQCTARGHTSSKGSVGGVELSFSAKNVGQEPLTLGRCELLQLPRSSLPTGLRLLHYPLQCSQLPMAMVEVAQDTLTCDTFAMMHTPSPAAGGLVGFLTWKRCAAIVDVQSSMVIAHCDAAGYSLQAGETIVLETVWMSDWTTPGVVWEAWPSLAAKSMGARLPQQRGSTPGSSVGRMPVGWLCWSWQDVTDPALNNGACAEEIYLQSAKALASQGFCERGMDFLWLSQTYLGDSDGYKTLPGAWTTEDPVQHPHGLAWLVEQVKALGFTNGLGLWCAPFWIPNLPSWVAKYGHCCLQDDTGKPIVHKTAWRFSTPQLTEGFLCLDGSHPDAQVRLCVCARARVMAPPKLVL